ncbi:hypothetical protein QJS10_CPA09g00281 [Acorus calamus]|uniref:DNA-directed RNA polymerase subunit n=1 Tax=Acorus calamus TaxID=4465 RepID=A0AAV9E2L5_ACOCL|nr:hypothetical protein QJS10_CPA09g00281 [Acorus calamus]
MEMDHRRGQDFRFCEVCGTLLAWGSTKHAKCPLCGFKKSMKEIGGKEISYKITAEDIRRELKLEPFVKLEEDLVDEGIIKRATVTESCPKCDNPELEYYTRQLRSADEGQTVFYECPKCRHKFSLNT